MLKTKWPSLAALAGAQVLALSLWFSATAVVPSLRAAGEIDALSASLFTSAVQAGFVVGTLVSAFFLTVLTTVLTIVNISIGYRNIIYGLVIIAAVLLYRAYAHERE